MGDITKKLKLKLISLSLMIFALSGVFSQEVTSGGSNLSENQIVDSKSRISEESDFVFETTPEEEKSQSTGTGWLFFRMILVLALVVLCIYGVFHFVKKSTNVTKDSDPYIKKVASLVLSPGKSVQIITVENHCYIIGVCDNNISLISELEDKTLIDAMNLNADSQTEEPKRDFASILSNFMGFEKKSTEEKLQKNITSIKGQSERLKKSSLNTESSVNESESRESGDEK